MCTFQLKCVGHLQLVLLIMWFALNLSHFILLILAYLEWDNKMRLPI